MVVWCDGCDSNFEIFMISVDVFDISRCFGRRLHAPLFVCSRVDLVAKTDAYNGAGAGVVGSGHKGA